MKDQEDVLMPKTISVPQITLNLTWEEAKSFLPNHSIFQVIGNEGRDQMHAALDANAKALIWAAVKAGLAHHDLDKLIDQRVNNHWVKHWADRLEANIGFTIVAHDVNGKTEFIEYEFIVAATRW